MLPLAGLSTLTGLAWLDASLMGVLGLLIGSFLNVVVHRVPKIMERQWAQEYAAMPGNSPSIAPPSNAPLDQEAFNLMVPPSRCPHCGHQIRWLENIPVVSYVFLRGRCASCAAPIGIRYPVVELATGALFAWCAWNFRFAASPYTVFAWCAFSAAILALALIDWDTTLLPDDITLPLLWGGLICAALGWTSTPLLFSLWGAVAGYLSLWAIYWGFKLVTGKEGMGYGDFKLFAALGAWFGWPALIPLILMASVVGAVVGIAMKFSVGLREGGYVPFGPFLAVAALVALLLGPQRVLHLVGL